MRTLLVALLLLGLTGCISSKDTIEKQAQVASVLVSDTHAAVDEGKREVSQARANIREAIPRVAPEIQIPLESAVQNLNEATRQFDRIDTNMDQADEALASITRNVEHVKDKSILPWWAPSAGLIVLIGAAVILMWSSGIAPVVMPVFRFIGARIQSVSDRINAKWNGPAKLAKEVAKGKTEATELIAALRGHFPKLDKAMREEA